MKTRLYWIDWLRVFAFMILLVYHSSVSFFPGMRWLIESPEKSEFLALVMDFPRAWRLALLFFVSGMGTWFAFRSVSAKAFLTQRTIRLLIPLLFAMCVILVPQVWYERRFEDGYTGGFFEFWFTRYFTEGRYPNGNFTWAHMWFVAYLLVMSFLLYPFMRLLVEPRMRWLTDRFMQLARGPAVYALFLLPLVLNLVLSPLFPRQTNTLINDGAWFATWACWFGFGFLFARHHVELLGSLIERRWLSAGIAAVMTVLLYRFAWIDPVIGDYENQTALYKTALFFLAWSMILALFGFGATHLNRKSEIVATLNRRIFPLYIVHQTVTVAALYYVLPLDLPLVWSWLLVVAATVGLSFLLVTLAEGFPRPLRLALGFADDRPSAASDTATEQFRSR